MAAQGEKHVSRRGATDKRAIPVTLCEFLDGVILPFQLTYTGKTERSLPKFNFSGRFCLDFSEKHWSKETETIHQIINVLVPYIKKVKDEQALLEAQKNLLVWDASKVQSTDRVMDRLSKADIVSVIVWKIMTHLFQLLDLTTSTAFKNYKKRAFSEYLLARVIDREITIKI